MEDKSKFGTFINGIRCKKGENILNAGDSKNNFQVFINFNVLNCFCFQGLTLGVGELPCVCKIECNINVVFFF